MGTEKDGGQQFDVDKLFDSTMKKEWDEVLSAYQKHPCDAPKAKLTKSEETALHIAVSSYHADEEDAPHLKESVTKLVAALPGGQEVEILGMRNDKGNTPLHFAAALGSVDICNCIALKDHTLLGKRNNKRETPFFLAAKHGKLEAFRCLIDVWNEGAGKEPDEPLFRRNDGCSILHAAIFGEYFELAYYIIQNYKKLVDRKNEEGLSPLHILAMKPSVFQSSSNLRLCDRMIYHCLIVPKLKEKEFGTEPGKSKFRPSSNKERPENYETCVNLVQSSWKMFKIIVGKNDENQKDEESQERPHEDCPENYKTCANLVQSSWKKFKNIVGKNGKNQKDEESQEEDNREGSFPPNYATCINLIKFAMNFLLIILGIGFSRIKKIHEKKEKHSWAKQIMDNLMEHEKSYKYGYDGQSPAENLRPDYAAIFAPPDVPFESDEPGNSYMEENNKSQKDEESDEEESDEDKPVEEERCVIIGAKMKENQTTEKLRRMLPDAVQELDPQQSFVLLRYQKRKTLNTKKETPILVAAKMGITEMVAKILKTFPVAIQDVDEHDKNALLLAVENRQTKVFDLLMMKKLPEFVLYQVDDEGNSALHLAAVFQQHQPWRIPGSALQMQWEIKWFKHVKENMPAQCLVQCLKNNKGETARQLFTRTHEKLLKDGSDWLIKTSESCSVVAALIATVAFATSSTVPGGIDDNTGDPVLKGQVAFDIFSIASLVALCFSVTALVFFLAILTSRCQKRDFRQDLPRKLLLGLSSLFTSIAGILLSFCAGHFFVLKDDLHNAAFFIYAITCLPITFFAFAQLPLYFDLLWSIFRKVPLRCYKVINESASGG